MKPNVHIKEITLTDESKVYDVILQHNQKSITFNMYDGSQAEKFAGDLLEVLRRNNFIF